MGPVTALGTSSEVALERARQAAAMISWQSDGASEEPP